MDKKLEQILRLYGEDETGGRRHPARMPAGGELADLQSVKQVLDARPRAAAPEDDVQHVLRLAAGDRQPQTPRRDRRPVAHGSKRSRPLFTAAGTTLVLLVMAGVLLFGLPEADPQTPAQTAPATSDLRQDLETPEAPEQDPVKQAEPTRRQSVADNRAPQRPSVRTPEAARPSPQRPARVAETNVVQVADASEAGLSWDDAQDVRRLHMMIDVVQGRAEEFEWDEPAVPLELLPNARSAARGGIQQVSQPLPRR